MIKIDSTSKNPYLDKTIVEKKNSIEQKISALTKNLKSNDNILGLSKKVVDQTEDLSPVKVIEEKDKDAPEKKTSELAKDLFSGAVAFGLTEGAKNLPGYGFGLYMFYQPVLYKYIEYKTNQKTSYRDKIANSALGQWSSRMYNGLTSNLHQFILKRKVALLFFERVQKKVMEPDNNGESLFSLEFSQVLKNVFFVAFDSIAENLKIDRLIEERFKGREASMEQKMIYRLHLLQARGKLPRGFPDLKKVGLDKYNIYPEIDKALNDYLEEFMNKLLTLLDKNFSPKKPSKISEIPGSISNLFSFFAYRLEIRDQLKAVATWYVKNVWIKPFLDSSNLFLLILSSCGIKTTTLDQEGYGLGSSQNLLNAGREFIDLLANKGSQKQFDDSFDRNRLRKSRKNQVGLHQEDITRKKLEDHFTELFYFLLKGKEKPTTVNLYQRFKKAMEQIPVVGQTFNSIHILGFGLYYCTTYLFSAKDDETLSKWLFQNLAGRKLARALARAFVHLLDHPMWTIVIMQAINTLEDSLFNDYPERYEPKKSKVFHDNGEIFCKFLLINILNNADKMVTVKNRDNMIKKGMKQVVAPFIENINQYLDHLPTKEQVISYAKESLSNTFEEYLLYMEMCLYFRSSFIKIEDDYKFWQMWFREHLIEWCDMNVMIDGYNPSPNFACKIPSGLKPWNARAKKIWSETRQKRISDIRTYIKQNRLSEILKEPKYNVSTKLLKKEFVVIHDYVKVEEEPEDLEDGFVMVMSPKQNKVKWAPTFPRKRKSSVELSKRNRFDKDYDFEILQDAKGKL